MGGFFSSTMSLHLTIQSQCILEIGKSFFSAQKSILSIGSRLSLDEKDLMVKA